MPKDSTPTRRSILNAGFQLFFKRGYARVSMEDIATKAGLTKRTLYYHFDSKDALVGAVLRCQNEQTLRQFQKWVDPTAKTPAEFADSLFHKLMLWSQKPNWRGSGYTRLALELADLPGHPARHFGNVVENGPRIGRASDRFRPQPTFCGHNSLKRFLHSL